MCYVIEINIGSRAKATVLWTIEDSWDNGACLKFPVSVI